MKTNSSKEDEQNRQKLQAMVRSTRALHLLLSLQSLSSGKYLKSKNKISAYGDEFQMSSEKYERLIGAIRVLEDDLRAERCKLSCLNTYNACADIARLCLFIAGICALLVFLS